jgi:hypothetical protein
LKLQAEFNQIKVTITNEVENNGGITVENKVEVGNEVEVEIANAIIAKDAEIDDGITVENTIEVEIEHTKRRILLEIADVITRTDLMIDVAITNAIEGISQVHDDVPMNWNASTQLSPDNHITGDIELAQHAMAIEIEQLLSRLGSRNHTTQKWNRNHASTARNYK